MIRTRCLVPTIVLLAVAVGCGTGASKDTKTVSQRAPATLPTNPWKLVGADPASDSPAYLSNGLIGVRVGANGSGLGGDGKPLSFLMSDEYDPTGEEKIRPLPHPLLVAWAFGNKLSDGKEGFEYMKSGGTPLDPRDSQDYREELDMQTGILKISWTQAAGEAGKVQVQCLTTVHPKERALGQMWTVTPEKKSSFIIRTIDYSGPNDPQRAIGGDLDSGIMVLTSPNRVVTMSWRLKGGESAAFGQRDGIRVQEGTTKPGEAITFERTLSFGPHAAKPLPSFDEKNVALLQKLAPKPFSFEEISAAAKANWAKRWQTDLEIDGPAEDQQAIRSFLFYLRSSIADHSISPFALSSTQYNGHIFWDADIWVFPALSLLDPDLAAQIPKYRLDPKILDGARAEYLRSNQVQNPGVSISVAYGPWFKYPWESSVTGQETVLGPSKQEIHISGSVLWGLNQAAALNLIPPKAVDRITKFGPYGILSQNSNRGSELKNVMSPDENHVGDNDLYTNLLAGWLQNGRKWSEPHPYVLPRDDKSFLTYDNDQLRGYKQAAAVLSIYPLQYPPAEKQAKVMMERFADKVIKNGPAMTDSVHSVIWARLGEDEKAYETWRASWEPFADNPLLIFSEKRHKNLGYFTTGAGGSLQAVLYGLLGFRLDYKQDAGSVWNKKLAGGQVLSIRPNLPKSWKSAKLKNFSVLGKRYTLTVTRGADGKPVARVTEGG